MIAHHDILIIGAGISGIGMACHLARECPQKNIAILERRQSIGGTWDLFRYPGIRSDSNMKTFCYRFNPWSGSNALGEGQLIRQYLIDTARQYKIDEHIHFGIKITAANWESENKRWIVTAIEESTLAVRTYSCQFLICATGYYNHDQGYLPDFPGIKDFEGQCIHPQHWPEDLNYKGKRVIVIGSGATAVTLLPAMARDTAHITMLQRSPSYVYSLPAYDTLPSFLRGLLSEKKQFELARLRNVRLQRLFYKIARRFPRLARTFLLSHVRRQLGNKVDIKHFSPRYMPWDERLCAVPDGDLFKVLKEGKASVVTDNIERFTPNGILLKSGKELAADIIVTATGLNVQLFGGLDLSVDGKIVPINQRMTCKGALIQEVPNMAYLFGYTNLSWTMKVEMAAEYICRLLNEMDQRRADVVLPRASSDEMQSGSIMDSLSSGYVQRGNQDLFRQGDKLPWRVLHDLKKDKKMYEQPIEDLALEWIAE